MAMRNNSATQYKAISYDRTGITGLLGVNQRVVLIDYRQNAMSTHRNFHLQIQ